MSSRPLKVGTRGSALALWQAEWVRDRLRRAGHETERIEIRTTGDIVTDVPLSRIGSRAIFTKQIDDALLEGRIDLAVHSLKDLPTALPEGIALAAVAEREDPSDALVGRGAGHVGYAPARRDRGHQQPPAPRAAPSCAGRFARRGSPRQRWHQGDQARRVRRLERRDPRDCGARATRPREQNQPAASGRGHAAGAGAGRARRHRARRRRDRGGGGARGASRQRRRWR